MRVDDGADRCGGALRELGLHRPGIFHVAGRVDHDRPARAFDQHRVRVGETDRDPHAVGNLDDLAPELGGVRAQLLASGKLLRRRAAGDQEHHESGDHRAPRVATEQSPHQGLQTPATRATTVRDYLKGARQTEKKQLISSSDNRRQPD